MSTNIKIRLLITITVSLGTGLALMGKLGFENSLIGFTKAAVGALILQFVIHNIFLSRKLQVLVEDTAAIDEVISLQTSTVSCPCGQFSFYTPIFINSDNIFTCEKCKSKFRVEVTLDSILITEPLNLETAYNFLKTKELS